MKLTKLSLKILLSIISIIFFTESARSQSGNMSDITLPSPDAMITEPPSENVGIEDNPATVEEGGIIEENLVPIEESTAVDGEVPVEESVTNDLPNEAVDAIIEENIVEENIVPVEEPTAVNDQLPVEEGVANDAPNEASEAIAEENIVPVEEPTAVNDQLPVEEGVANDTPNEASEAIAEENIVPVERGDDAVLGENAAGDATETSNLEQVRNLETSDNQASQQAESATLEQEEVPLTDIETINEARNIRKDRAESNEIVEKLVEEGEVRSVQDTREAKEKVAQEELEAEQESVAEEEASPEEESATEETELDVGQLDRGAFEALLQGSSSDLAIQMQEEFQLTQLIDSSGLELYGTVPSVKDISQRLAQLAEQTGKKTAFINISLQSNQLESFVVLPEQVQANADGSVVASTNLNAINTNQAQASTVRKTVKNTSRKDLIATATQFREEISDVRNLNQSNYKSSAKELYDVLIKPIEEDLEANDIDVLVFSMDSGLRLLPIAALHDGEQFLIEKYAMGMVPSFGLTDTRYVSPEQSSILAMGASEFEEQAALPTMPIELETIISNPRRGESFLNEQFTIPNFIAQNSKEAPFSIVHLGTHAEFNAGDLNNSYIQFYDEKLKIPQLQELSNQLGWSTNATPIELLVLSACETAIGDREAELGFAGLAVQAGVKSALASLWYVSDLGTLALMGEFYDQLGDTLIKAEALRQTQLEMLQGNVKIDNRQVKLSNGVDLPLPKDFPDGTLSLDHPYFWSSFTLIGNWN